MQSWKKKINKTLHKNSFFFKQYLNIFPFSHYKFVFWAWKISFVGLCFVMIPGGWLSSHCEPIYPSTRPKIKKKKKSFVKPTVKKCCRFDCDIFMHCTSRLSWTLCAIYIKRWCSCCAHHFYTCCCCCCSRVRLCQLSKEGETPLCGTVENPYTGTMTYGSSFYYLIVPLSRKWTFLITRDKRFLFFILITGHHSIAAHLIYSLNMQTR